MYSDKEISQKKILILAFFWFELTSYSNDQKGSMLIKTSASPEKSKKRNVTKQKQTITASPTKKTDMMASSTKKTDGDCSVVTPEYEAGRVKSARYVYTRDDYT